MTQFIHIPYGKVTGRIGFNEDTIAVSGYGYMDHIFQTASSIDLVDRSLSFSMPYSDSMYAGRVSLSKNGFPLGYAVFIQNGKPEIITPKQVLENGKNYSGKSFPKQELILTWVSSIPELKIDVSKVQQKFSILNNFDGWFAKKAAKLLMGGEVWFYRGRSFQEKKAIDWSLTGL
jgi:predicted secreted hydrolase